MRTVTARRSAPRSAIAALALCGLTACKPIGPRQLPIDRFDYNAAIADSASQQMLLNLVRLRFGEVPTFLAVNSVLTQYVWTGELGVAGTGGESLNFPAWTVGGSANFRYIERPTVTYSPLSGQEFASQLLSPVRADVVFSLVSSGWPPDQLLSVTIQRINDIENVSFADTRARTRTEPREFDRIIDLVIQIADRNALELVRSSGPDQGETYLDFAAAPDEPTAALIAELKSTLGLDPARNRFRVTRRIVGRAPDEITIRTHSLLELMGLLSAGVADPVAAVQDEVPRHAGPLTVRCSPKPPESALVTVRYADNWYHISRDDEDSKRAFGLLIYLFQMQASQNPGAGPLITVPIG